MAAIKGSRKTNKPIPSEQLSVSRAELEMRLGKGCADEFFRRVHPDQIHGDMLVGHNINAAREMIPKVRKDGRVQLRAGSGNLDRTISGFSA